LLVADDDILRDGQLTMRSTGAAPKAEDYCPEEVIFPFAKARLLALRTKVTSSVLEDPTPIKLALPWDAAGDVVGIGASSSSDPPVHLPRSRSLLSAW